ncbi:MAG: glycosyltransferase, partial [Syntrophobacteraceae bacterium]
IIGDETYELTLALQDKRIDLGAPFVMIYDFIGMDAMSNSIVEKLGIYYFNWKWSKDGNTFEGGTNMALFIGELEDIEDKRFGIFLPNRRELARTYCNFIGYTLQFDPADYTDITKIRSRLGYGPEPMIMCSIGGTAVGKDLLELCGLAFPIIKKQIPNLRMVLVCGPRLPDSSLNIPPGPEVKQYIPDLYKHNACCDLAIVQGGGSTTLELTALRRPFLYFPLEGHCEQEIAVASRLARHRAGVRMHYKDTSPESLAQQVISNLGKKTDYADIPVNGTYEAARLINEKL